MYTFLPKYTKTALLNEYIADMLTNPNLDKNIRFAPGYLELDEDLIIGNRVTMDFGGIKNGGIVTNGFSIDIAATWVNLRNMDILHSGYGAPVHVNYGRFTAENVLTANSSNNGRTRGAAYAFDSLQNNGTPLSGAYTNDVENCHMNDGPNQSKHFVSAVSWLPISGVTGTFQRNEPITASGGKYAEVIKVGAGWLKVIGRIGLFDGVTITGGISGATATVGTVTNTDFNSHTFYDNNVICPYPYIYHRGGGSKAVDGQYQSGSAGAAIGAFVTQREQASSFGINGFIYIEKYANIQDSDNGQYQYVHSTAIHSDNNGALTNYPARFITGGGSYTPPAIATQAEAEAGSDNTKMMTPLRVAQAIAGGSPPPAEVLIDLSAQTVTGNMTNQGGLSSLYDGNKNKSMLTCARYSVGGGTGTVIVDYGTGNSKVLKRVKAWGSNNSGYDTTSSIINVIQAGYGSNDGTNWTPLFSSTFSDNNGVNQKDHVPTSTTAYRYHKFEQTASGSAHPVLCQMEFYE